MRNWTGSRITCGRTWTISAPHRPRAWAGPGPAGSPSTISTTRRSGSWTSNGWRPLRKRPGSAAWRRAAISRSRAGWRQRPGRSWTPSGGCTRRGLTPAAIAEVLGVRERAIINVLALGPMAYDAGTSGSPVDPKLNAFAQTWGRTLQPGGHQNGNGNGNGHHQDGPL